RRSSGSAGSLSATAGSTGPTTTRRGGPGASTGFPASAPGAAAPRSTPPWERPRRPVLRSRPPAPPRAPPAPEHPPPSPEGPPAPVREWLPLLADALGAQPPRHFPVRLARLFAGKPGMMLATEARGASNARAKRELGWTLRYPTWRQGFPTVYASAVAATATPTHAPVPG